MLPSVERNARQCVEELFHFITIQGDGDYIGEKVSQLEHSLQAAQLAVEAGADDDTVLGALLHDVGRFIPAAENMPAMIAPNGVYVGRESHEILGEKYLRQLGFSESICQLVGAHVMAKRYLTAVDKGYYDGLSQSSKTTLKFQGGIFTEEQVREAEKDPLLSAKLAVRRWDDLAKVPNMETLPLRYYERMAINSLLNSRSVIEVNGRRYNLPRRPTAVICIDGFDPEYLERGISDGIIPHMASFVRSGFSTTATCAMPSFTNPNNVSIISGAPTSVHGIAGNFFLDRSTRREQMIVDDKLLRGTTILEQMANRGVRVAAITAKDKLLAIINHGLDCSKGAICFSAQCANKCTVADHGISEVEEWLGLPTPEQYSGDLSLFVLKAGAKLLEEDRADLLYLTLSDYVQHKYAPGSKESNEFMSAIDQCIGRLVELGATVAVTGDHGMSDKSKSDGSPNLLFLEEELNREFGQGFARIICPIIDPFVRHHGALGSFVRIYLNREGVSIEDVLQYCRSFPQIELAVDGKTAAEKFQMPLDREGDIVAIAKKDAVLGSRKEEHDLTNLRDHRLRSHGGLSEQHIPLLRSLPVTDPAGDREWRNFDAFDLALNF
ncbi:phosphonoacetate hydrolase [Rhinocladiella mackenziei CBS 650.93]|uniref:Rhinocladiella mackenziei CBS 650.93 unplaced genomic scaffold supercont1.5, whole genome shotgun sequence n=1 Tax=Rhinocladiella mackenziei CBS 650.93 TaxID=1442369 RepID=A0A0D2FMQ7_9EURO|nr:phosphonoacetate hydrolase [Rhinocladiella mackenziei CBS 650.93]KIX03322.1 phosphonoacetate hydrolase [Rhinocladiella mackenziei CBS 650.93]